MAYGTPQTALAGEMFRDACRDASDLIQSTVGDRSINQ